MTIRRTFTIGLLASLAVAAACSGKPDQPTHETLTGPSATVTADPFPGGGGVSRPAVVDFPPRAEALDFRTQLETKYATGLGRRPAQVFVDMEGEATWIGEYYRYRVNGCDHDTATQRALTQIDGAAPGPVCAVRFFPETAIYPPRDHVVDFRRQLGAKYQAMGRSAQSAVDPEGAAIWMGEYFRYRTSGCDHPTASQRTLVQIDGQPAPPTCLVACAYYVSTPAYAPPAGGTFSAQPIRTSGACEWLAESLTPWIHLNRPITGGDRSVLTYNVEANSGTTRVGTIRINYPGGAAFLDVSQGTPTSGLAFQFFDPATSTSPTTECLIKTRSTICTLTATGGPIPIATYDWRVEYAYGGTKIKSQVGPLSTFSFTESCGVSASEGSVVPISVRLIATDTQNNITTVYSGQFGQPPLQLRTFNCP